MGTIFGIADCSTSKNLIVLGTGKYNKTGIITQAAYIPMNYTNERQATLSTIFPLLISLLTV
jgi:hypothetical protein